MKPGKITLIAALVIMLTACSKKDQLVQDLPGNSISPKAAQGIFISSWETGYNWNMTDSSGYRIYVHDRALTEINNDVLNGGAVLMFVKNAPYTERGRLNKPMLTPFHVLPPEGRPGYDQVWYRVVNNGSVSVRFRTNAHQLGVAGERPDGEVAIRYFVIPAFDLKKMGHSAISISKLNYAALSQLFGLKD